MSVEFSCHALSQIYPNQTMALDNVSFQVAHHQFVAIVGPSGCGKTTLLKIIGGLLKPTQGQVEFKQTHVTRAMVFQEHGLLPWLNLLDNVAFGLEAQGLDRVTRHQKALHMITPMGLAAFANHYPHELSVGMRQRVGVARALLVQPQILLMDEPFGALDAQTKKLLQLELLQLWEQQQNTVIYITHDIEEALLLSDRILVMSGRPGQIQADLAVPFARPRQLELLEKNEVRELRWQIWHMLASAARQNLAIPP